MITPGFLVSVKLSLKLGGGVAAGRKYLASLQFLQLQDLPES